MATKPRRGSWRKVAPGKYVKAIGTYSNVKFGASVRVSFVPFPTCEIIDANGAHAAIPAPADAKKYTAAAKKVYTKDTKAEAERLGRRGEAQTRPAPKGQKWHPGIIHQKGVGIHEDPAPGITHPFRPGETKSSPIEARVERKLTTTDAARRSKAHSLWMSGKETGTPRDIYLRLYAADEKKYRK